MPPEFTDYAGQVGRSIYDCPERSQSEIRDDAVEAARERVREWIKHLYASDVMELLERCDGDADAGVVYLLGAALREPWSSGKRRHAEDVLDALAQAEADREVER